jgi:hypothetical protein
MGDENGCGGIEAADLGRTLLASRKSGTSRVILKMSPDGSFCGEIIRSGLRRGSRGSFQIALGTSAGSAPTPTSIGLQPRDGGTSENLRRELPICHRSIFEAKKWLDADEVFIRGVLESACGAVLVSKYKREKSTHVLKGLKFAEASPCPKCGSARPE